MLLGVQSIFLGKLLQMHLILRFALFSVATIGFYQIAITLYTIQLIKTDNQEVVH